MAVKKALGFFRLTMINVIAVDSVRTLTFSSVYGFSLVFFYLLMGLFFLIPTALVSAELGTGWPNRGGLYVWVREAFGKRWSLVIIWLNWVYNLIWYPTIMALTAGIFAYIIDPDLADNRIYMCSAVLILFWAATGINCYGMQVSSALSTLGAILGTLFPMIFIGILGAIWIFQGKPLEIECSWDKFFPGPSQIDNMAFLTNVLFGLLGLEMAATHAAEMENPARDYPRSMIVSVILILTTIIGGSLGIAVVVPNQELSLAVGIMQAFSVFFHNLGLSWLLPWMAISIILGCLSGVSAWIIGPTKGLLVACRDGSLPHFFGHINRHGMPTRILFVQACIVSLLCLLFILLPTVNSSYWLLSLITAQLALCVYIALFAAAIKLHYHKPEVRRSFRIPGGAFGIWSVCLPGLLTCLTIILIGFLPPRQIPFKSILAYEVFLAASMVFFILPPFLLAFRKNQNAKH